MFKHNDKVAIKSKTNGCYSNVTGTIVSYLTTNRQKWEIDQQMEKPFLEYHGLISDMYRVRFDKPVNISTDPNNPRFIENDVFSANDLTLIDSKEK